MVDIRRRDTKESKAFWARIEAIAKEVHTWDNWEEESELLFGYNYSTSDPVKDALKRQRRNK